MGGGGGGNPTLQQRQLQAQQAQATAQLNVQENDQRKIILNAMAGTRNFRESALSRSLGGNNNDAPAAQSGAPSTAQQINTYGQITGTPTASLFDQVNSGMVAAAAARGAPSGGRGAGGGTK